MTGWLIALALALLAALAVFLIAPARAHRANAWRGTAFAHRGLHGDGAEENTLEAFERACCAGYGIELDVQLSRDGEVVVFHDDSLRRMTGDARRVDQLDWAQLRALRDCVIRPQTAHSTMAMDPSLPGQPPIAPLRPAAPGFRALPQR